MNMDHERLKEFFDECEGNDRPYAGYFSGRLSQDVDEIGVVQSFFESLEQKGEGFFHSYSSRGRGNDPPDCEAVSNEGHRIAIEVTELVDGESISRAEKKIDLTCEPFTKADLHERLNKLIRRKDKPPCVQGGPYQHYILLIFCDGPRARHYDLIQHAQDSSFPNTELIDRAFLLYSYCPWEKCCPYIELNLRSF